MSPANTDIHEEKVRQMVSIGIGCVYESFFRYNKKEKLEN